jgi:hypothetical protein
VLVVVEDRDVEQAPEPVLDLEAARRGDVLQVDAAEAGHERGGRRDDLAGAGADQSDRHRVDVSEPLNSNDWRTRERDGGIRVAIVTQNAGALLASVRPLV